MTKDIICAEHPKYKAKRKPMCACEKCWWGWFKKQKCIECMGATKR